MLWGPLALLFPAAYAAAAAVASSAVPAPPAVAAVGVATVTYPATLGLYL